MTAPLTEIVEFAGPQPRFESDVPGETFHSRPLMHTHRSCKNCRRFRRCTSDGKSMDLMRCKGCEIESYCSKECQVHAWKTGHKALCKRMSDQKEDVLRLTGNAGEWGRFTRWVEYHHTSLINAALAAYSAAGPKADENHVLFVDLYRSRCLTHGSNCDDIPYEQSLFPANTYLAHRDSTAGKAFDYIFDERELAMPIVKREHGKDYGGTGAYVLFRTYAHGTPDEKVLPFWMFFGFNKYDARARPIGNPLELLHKNLREGHRVRFCCGKIVEAMGGSSCCCGGWTHDTKEDVQPSSEVD
ncbi:unnamed protein product [Peniophora sp. CBMAI 1063]|nr:unnamed protein product [Peniophora sp. CBMAI 1063]